jgi:hypothetical protein
MSIFLAINNINGRKVFDYRKKEAYERQRNEGGKQEGPRQCYVCFDGVRYACMAFAAFLPAPMAEMTVAEPVTMSPPA